jgi:hypothetical protein
LLNKFSGDEKAEGSRAPGQKEEVRKKIIQ